jgi:hypothetical protein
MAHEIHHRSADDEREINHSEAKKCLALLARFAHGPVPWPAGRTAPRQTGNRSRAQKRLPSENDVVRGAPRV